MAERTCPCGFVFFYLPEWWIARNLSEPRRCPDCRRTRREQKQANRLEGQIVYFNDARGFGFLEARDGEKFYFNRKDIDDIEWRPLVVPHQGVTWQRNDRESRPGYHARASSILRIERPTDGLSGST